MSGSLPVDIYLEEFVQGDALTADKYMYNNIGNVLLEKGLALPKLRYENRISSNKNFAEIANCLLDFRNQGHKKIRAKQDEISK